MGAPEKLKAADPARVWHIDIIVTEGFVLIEMSAILEVLRIANRVLAQPPFKWTVRSLQGGRVGCRAGLSVDTEPFAAKPDADFAFFLGNSDPDHPGLSLGRVISSYTCRDIKVYLLAEAAARYIRDQGGAAGRLTTHWENSALLRERMGLNDSSHALASEDGPVVTCAGMGSTVDIILALVGRLTSAAAQMTVGNIMLHEQVRDFSSLQPFAGAKPTITGDSDLDHCIRIMQDNIEEPVPISDIVDELGISTRSLERKFRDLPGNHSQWVLPGNAALQGQQSPAQYHHERPRDRSCLRLSERILQPLQELLRHHALCSAQAPPTGRGQPGKNPQGRRIASGV